MPWMALAAQAIPAIMGALSGGQKSGSSTTVSRELLPQTQTGTLGEQTTMQNLPMLQKYVNAGANLQDVRAGVGSQRDLASMLQNFAQGGFMPTQQDWASANQFAQSSLAPQQTMMRQGFQEQNQRTAQLAAQMGRPVNDPILQARLAREQMQGMERLGAQQSSIASQFAQNLPGQRLGYMQNLAQVRQGLASQAMANRQALIGIGSQLEQAGNQFRTQAAGTTQTTSSGGGQAGAINGFLAGAGGLMGTLAGMGSSSSNTPGTGSATTGASSAAPASAGMPSYSAPAPAASFGVPQALSPNYSPPAANPSAFANGAPAPSPWVNASGGMVQPTVTGWSFGQPYFGGR